MPTVAGAAIDDDPPSEFSGHGRDPRFSDGRATVLLLVAALVIAVAIVALAIAL